MMKKTYDALQALLSGPLYETLIALQSQLLFEPTISPENFKDDKICKDELNKKITHILKGKKNKQYGYSTLLQLTRDMDDLVDFIGKNQDILFYVNAFEKEIQKIKNSIMGLHEETQKIVKEVNQDDIKNTLNNIKEDYSSLNQYSLFNENAASILGRSVAPANEGKKKELENFCFIEDYEKDDNNDCINDEDFIFIERGVVRK